MDPYLQSLRDEIQWMTTSLNAEDLTWHPPGKWSAGEILEHLYLTYTGTIKGFSRVLESEPVRKQQSLKMTARAFIVLKLRYFPNGVEAPAFSRPKGASSTNILADIGPKIAEMDTVLATCEAKFGARAKVLDHPFLGPFSVAQWREFHLRHGMHHLKQIHRLRKLKAQ